MFSHEHGPVSRFLDELLEDPPPDDDDVEVDELLVEVDELLVEVVDDEDVDDELDD